MGRLRSRKGLTLKTRHASLTAALALALVGAPAVAAGNAADAKPIA